MIEYCPYAVVNEGKKKNRLQYTYDNCRSIKECIETFNLWEDHYKMNIVEAYIDVLDCGKVTKRIPVTKEWVTHEDKVVLNPLAYVEV